MARTPSTSCRPGDAARHPLRRTLVAVGAVVALLGSFAVSAGPASAASAAAVVRGVDVSSHQHPDGAAIDWARVEGAGYSFAYIKATEGADYTNPWFGTDWRGAGSAGLARGAYHFAQPAKPLRTATDQARHFVARTGTMTGARDLAPVLDLEMTGGLGPTDLARWTRTWMDEVERLTGREPILYTGPNFWRDRLGSPTDISARYRLWLASYRSDWPAAPKGWSSWTFWQWTSQGRVPGIAVPVDLNVSCCSASRLPVTRR